MDDKARKKAAAEFARAWAGRGYEKGDAQVFWTELLQQVVGLTGISQQVKFEYRTPEGGFIDCLIPDAGVLIEQKGRSIDLDAPEKRQGRMVTPFQQALAYAESFRPTKQPRFIVVCNFRTFRVHDRESCPRNELAEKYLEFTLEELGEAPHLLGFITDAARARSEKERQVSMQAGALIGKLYDALRAQYLDAHAPESAHALNVLCVRLVFCLFCEDAPGLFPKDAFLDYLRRVEPEDMRQALRRLFRALDTPLSERDPYDEKLKPFPYVNGGLFADDVEIPNFTPELKHLLLFEVSQQTNWAKISPTIFGGIFESTLNPETRHTGGMHYTSPENIHKVIDPLFLDGLYDELNAALALPSAGGSRKKRLRKLHARIAGLEFLDPACGSGNFLTETYLSLRRIEDDILNALNDGQTEIAWGEDSATTAVILSGGSEATEVEGSRQTQASRSGAAQTSPRVSLSQFHGIEINDFAVRVAKTALWIAQLQANDATDMLLDLDAESFPLRDSANIVQANALRVDWNDVLPARECDYVMGNPPFVGQYAKTAEQAADVKLVWGDDYDGYLDYATCWYRKAADYLQGSGASFAFVSTNSITQGQPVPALFKPLVRDGWHISFAHRSFVWDSEAADQAHVHCVIVGMAQDPPRRTLFSYEHGKGEPTVTHPGNVNGYLLDAPDVYVEKRSKPLNGRIAPMTYGSKPTDGGYLQIKSREEYDEAMKDAVAAKFVRRCLGASELINGHERWCLWLEDASFRDISASPLLKARVAACHQWRAEQTKTGDAYKLRDVPHLFRPNDKRPRGSFLCVPCHFSSGRRYFTAARCQEGEIATNACFTADDPDGFQFALISSSIFMAWQKAVGGELKSDCRFSNTIVWNNFPLPELDDEAYTRIVAAGRAVNEARKGYEGASLAQLYKPEDEWLFPKLTSAHAKLDAAVEAAYGVDFAGDEEKMVAHLFTLYAEATKE